MMSSDQETVHDMGLLATTLVTVDDGVAHNEFESGNPDAGKYPNIETVEEVALDLMV